jgi:hypothetical protein
MKPFFTASALSPIATDLVSCTAAVLMIHQPQE